MTTVTKLRALAEKCDKIADKIVRPQSMIMEWRDNARFLRELADKIESNPEFAYNL